MMQRTITTTMALMTAVTKESDKEQLRCGASAASHVMRTAKVEQQSNQRMKEGGVDGCAIIQDGGGGTQYRAGLKEPSQIV